uniref:Uncharacterized protein n=1 Tax=Erwinia amylovora ATCC BAA-2158 TaxID=889211 RepID=E5B8Z9_ERWAM|nr:hypothetical protein predicted by Glimmer/Critica [Erwinia amylovora ATCC BAA-2158]
MRPYLAICASGALAVRRHASSPAQKERRITQIY